MVRLRDFSFTYPGAASPALRRLTLDVGPGEFVGICGAEGSGRTTLFRVLNGSAVAHFRGAHTGTAMVGGLDACLVGHPALGAFTASIFDDPDSQIVSLTVEEEVGFALVQRGASQEETALRVAAALDEVGLGGFQSRATASLSGGQKQRLVLASALALDPRLVLLDESASALDPRGGRELYTLLGRLCRERGVAVVAVEKDLELLMEKADRIVVLDDGAVVMNGRPSELAAKPALLEAAGLRVPVWLKAVKLLADRGLVEAIPGSEAEALSLMARLMEAA